jgi:hypothetical protein
MVVSVLFPPRRTRVMEVLMPWPSPALALVHRFLNTSLSLE